MDREIDAAVDQRLLDLLGEQALAAFLGEIAVGHQIAAGADDGDLDRAGFGQLAMRRRQPAAQFSGLGQRERAAAGAKAQKGRGHGLFLSAYGGEVKAPLHLRPC